MAQLIRIEHPEDGKGLWRSQKDGISRIDYHSQEPVITDRHSKWMFPTPYEDAGLRAIWPHLEGRYLFGFLSIEQLKTALTPEEMDECIESLGFRVYLIEADDMIVTEFQGVFDPDTIVEKTDITSLFTLSK